MQREAESERLEVEREESSSAFCLVFPLHEVTCAKEKREPIQ